MLAATLRSLTRVKCPGLRTPHQPWRGYKSRARRSPGPAHEAPVVVNRDTLLYELDRPGFFRAAFFAGSCNVVFWTYMAYVAMTWEEDDKTNVFNLLRQLFSRSKEEHKDANAGNVNPLAQPESTQAIAADTDNLSAPEPADSAAQVTSTIALSEHKLVPIDTRVRYASACVGIAWMFGFMAYILPRRFIRSLTLLQGGTKVGVETYTAFGTHGFVVERSGLEALMARQDVSARSYLPIRLPGRRANFLVDLSGDIRDPALFDKILKCA